MHDYYTSTEAFERFAQLTAIGILSLTVMRKASRESDPSGYVEPWAALADRLHFDALAGALREASPRQWRESSHMEHVEDAADTHGLSGSWQDKMEESVQAWFALRVQPLLQVGLPCHV